jgi:hypothetical protein
LHPTKTQNAFFISKEVFMISAVWVPPPKFFKLIDSPYIDEKEHEPSEKNPDGFFWLKPDAPPEIIKLNKELGKIWDKRVEEANRTGSSI